MLDNPNTDNVAKATIEKILNKKISCLSSASMASLWRCWLRSAPPFFLYIYKPVSARFLDEKKSTLSASADGRGFNSPQLAANLPTDTP
jgi:hypothetical protein